MQAEDGIRNLVRSRGLGDGYERQNLMFWLKCIYVSEPRYNSTFAGTHLDKTYELASNRAINHGLFKDSENRRRQGCLFYTSDAADDLLSLLRGALPTLSKNTLY